MNRRKFLSISTSGLLGLSAGCLSSSDPQDSNSDIVFSNLLSSYEDFQSNNTTINELKVEIEDGIETNSYSELNKILTELTVTLSDMESNLKSIEEKYTILKDRDQELSLIERSLSIMSRALSELNEYINLIQQSIEYRINSQSQSAFLSKRDASIYYSKYRNDIELLPNPETIQSSYYDRY